MEFKPGAYTKGTQTTSLGITYVANVDIKNALALPRPGVYWSVVGPTPKPEPTPLPSKFIIDLTQVGLLPTNTGEQNSTAIQKFIDSLPIGATNWIHLPTGHYHFARQIHFDSRPVHFTGDNDTIFSNYGTRLIFPDGSNGIFIERKQHSQGMILENLCLVAQNKTIEWCSGVGIRARVTLRNITTKGFSHNGIDFWASIEGEGTDASGSWVEHCHSLENGHDGYFAGRADANCITFIGCDSRDNGRYGFNDDSFLGNNFISCMAHYNKAGDFFVRDKGNAFSGFSYCYSEGGNTPSDLSTHSTIIQGIWGSPYHLGDNVMRYRSYLPQ